MRVQVAKWGNSTAVRLPKSVVEELGVKPGEQLELIVEGREARLKPLARKTPRYDIKELIAECDRIGWENQPPYEDWTAVEAPWPPYEPDDRH